MQTKEEFRKDVENKYRDASVWINGNPVMINGTVTDTQAWEEKLERAWEKRKIWKWGRLKRLDR